MRNTTTQNQAINALCPACKQPQDAPSCERREHWLPSPENAESVYLRQRATIAAAIELLQATLDNMANPEFCSILWGDVTEHTHVAAAANTLMESLTES